MDNEFYYDKDKDDFVLSFVGDGDDYNYEDADDY